MAHTRVLSQTNVVVMLVLLREEGGGIFPGINERDNLPPVAESREWKTRAEGGVIIGQAKGNIERERRRRKEEDSGMLGFLGGLRCWGWGWG